jgi:hypothetical protein
MEKPIASPRSKKLVLTILTSAHGRIHYPTALHHECHEWTNDTNFIEIGRFVSFVIGAYTPYSREQRVRYGIIPHRVTEYRRCNP